MINLAQVIASVINYIGALLVEMHGAIILKTTQGWLMAGISLSLPGSVLLLALAYFIFDDVCKASLNNLMMRI